jgi:hypothetical protein
MGRREMPDQVFCESIKESEKHLLRGERPSEEEKGKKSHQNIGLDERNQRTENALKGHQR